MAQEALANASISPGSISSNSPDPLVHLSTSSRSAQQDVQQMDDEVEAAVRRAAQSIRSAHAIVIISSNGMVIDCPLPDLRGKQGFWNTFPGLKALGKCSSHREYVFDCFILVCKLI